MFGLSEGTLKQNGVIVPTAIGLSHSEQFDRLAEGCPDALPRAFLAGDPCFDRILASLPRRLHYRHAFGLRPGQRLILVNSTWRDNSLFGLHRSLVSRLLEELPYDEFRIALVLHPNAWAAHSEGQIKSWLFDAQRSGLLLLPPVEGWRAAVIAADHVLSDHGSVGIYAAAAGRPVLLEQSGRSWLDPRSGLGRLFEVAPALDPHAPIRPQLLAAERARERTHELAVEWVSSAPWRSLALIRDEAYRIMKAAPPSPEPPLLADELPSIDAPSPASVWTELVQSPGELSVRRWPAAVAKKVPGSETRALISSDRELDHRLVGMADIIRTSPAELPADEDTWSASVFEYRPGAQLTLVHDKEQARMRHRDGRIMTLRLATESPDAELIFAALATLLFNHPTAWDELESASPLILAISPDRKIKTEFSRG